MEADFSGGQVSSDGGLQSVREVDRKLGLLRRVARHLMDEQQDGKVAHTAETMLRQRVMA